MIELKYNGLDAQSIENKKSTHLFGIPDVDCAIIQVEEINLHERDNGSFHIINIDPFVGIWTQINFGDHSIAIPCHPRAGQVLAHPFLHRDKRIRGMKFLLGYFAVVFA